MELTRQISGTNDDTVFICTRITVGSNCKNDCGMNCGCRKVGFQCTIVCRHYNGRACLNVLSVPSDFNRD